MKNPGIRTAFARFPCALAATMAAVLAGCATATLEDAVPVAATPAVVQPVSDGSAATPDVVPVEEAVVASGPVDTGTFPNLNIAPRVAAEAFSTRETASNTSAIRRAQAGQQGRGDAEGAAEDNETLKRLAKTHGEETLEAIEKPDRAEDATPLDAAAPATN